MPLLSRAESQFLRRHLAAARQVTLRRADGCVVRLHLLPPRRPQPDLPFLLLRFCLPAGWRLSNRLPAAP